MMFLPVDGSMRTHLVSVAPGELVQRLVIETPDAVSMAPTPDGGLYVMNLDGTLLTYDSEGVLTDELPTGVETSGLLPVTQDETTGRLAFGGLDETVIVEPQTGSVEVLSDLPGVDALAFARDGELLVVIGNDGDVRLWDVERGVSAGLIWDGTGSRPGSYPYYNDKTETLWVATSGQLLEVPLSPSRWLEKACELVGRDFTQAEWDRFVPGDGPLRSACDIG